MCLQTGPLIITGLCYIRERQGYRHFSGSFRDTLSVSNPAECSYECRRSLNCRSFSYRYFFGSSDSPIGSENCLLSNLDARNLNTVSDLIVDSNWDVYRQQCRDGEGGGGIGIVPGGGKGNFNVILYIAKPSEISNL